MRKVSESALAKKGWIIGRDQGVWVGFCSRKVMVQIFYLNILCYEYAILWLLSLKGCDNISIRKGCGSALAKKGGIRRRDQGVRGVFCSGNGRVQIF